MWMPIPTFRGLPIEGHHFNAGISGLMFLPLPIGGIFAVVTVRFRSAIYATPCPDILVHSTCSFSTPATNAPLSSTKPSRRSSLGNSNSSSSRLRHPFLLVRMDFVLEHFVWGTDNVGFHVRPVYMLDICEHDLLRLGHNGRLINFSTHS
jgi:hypothetical protein